MDFYTFIVCMSVLAATYDLLTRAGEWAAERIDRIIAAPINTGPGRESRIAFSGLLSAAESLIRKVHDQGLFENKS